jgi:hypothetical protein
LKPGKTLSIEVKLDRYTYAEGDWVRAKASKELPPGKYRVTIDIRFPVKGAAGGEPPIWPNDSIASSPVQIEIKR